MSAPSASPPSPSSCGRRFPLGSSSSLSIWDCFSSTANLAPRRRSSVSYASLSGYHNPDVAYSKAGMYLTRRRLRERLSRGFQRLRGRRHKHQFQGDHISNEIVEPPKCPSQIWYERHLYFAGTSSPSSSFVSSPRFSPVYSFSSNSIPDLPYASSGPWSHQLEREGTGIVDGITDGRQSGFGTDPITEIEENCEDEATKSVSHGDATEQITLAEGEGEANVFGESVREMTEATRCVEEEAEFILEEITSATDNTFSEDVTFPLHTSSPRLHSHASIRPHLRVFVPTSIERPPATLSTPSTSSTSPLEATDQVGISNADSETDQSDSDKVYDTETETESEYEYDSAKWWSRFNCEGHEGLPPFLYRDSPGAVPPLRRASDDDALLETVEAQLNHDDEGLDTDAVISNQDPDSTETEKSFLAAAVPLREQKRPDRTYLTTLELLYTERSYLNSLRTLLSPGSTLTPAPPLMLTYTRSLVSASEDFMHRLAQCLKYFRVGDIVFSDFAAAERALAGRKADIHCEGDAVTILAQAFLETEAKIGSAMLSWCGVVGSFFVGAEGEGNVSKSKGRNRSLSSSAVILARSNTTAGTQTEEFQKVCPKSSVWRRSMSSVSPISLTFAGLGSPTRACRPKSGGNRTRSRSRGGHQQAPIHDQNRDRRKPSVRDLAILPTQRVMRYVLLFKDLLIHTPTTQPCYPALEQALHAAQRIASKCDRAQDNAAFLI